ncbi:MAG TPA: PorP/SprF family type IX secretion system membrane protein [Chitinophagaceae bacterium]|nr:PorP/SprF family type IX secretion system membrane protein [Chitinophagaceae bacterium]
MKNVLSIAMLIACSCTCYAQDPHFSQFFDAPLLRNPSLAGLFNGDVRVNSVYRSQWGSITVPYQTGSFDVEYKQPVGRGNDYVTMGMEILYDRAGTTNFTTSDLLPAINYHKALSGDKNKYLSVGFMGGYVQRHIDRSKITTNNQYDGTGYNPSLSDGEALTQFNYHYWDGSVGVSFNSSIAGSSTDNYFVGVAYHHFNRPKNSFYVNPPVELNPKLVLSAGVKFGLDEVSYLTLDADISHQGNYNDMIAGAMYSYKLGTDPENPDYVIHFGGYLRWKDAFIPVVKIDYNPFSIGFSYDANISQLKAVSQSRGGFELSISYIGFLQRGNTTRDAVLCPRF